MGARESYIVTALTNRSLTSIGKFCDAGCEASFNQHTMAVTKDEQVPLKGTRDVMTGLQRVTIHILDRTTHQINHLHQVNGKENDIKYTHATAFSLVQDTWAKAFNRGYFNTWSGLTAKDIDKMTKSESTIKDHIAQSRKKYRSTITNKSSGEDQGHLHTVKEI